MAAIARLAPHSQSPQSTAWVRLPERKVMSRSSRLARAAVGGVALALAGGLHAVASPSYAGSHARIAVPLASRPASLRPQLLAVAASSPANAWAVGTRIEHWDGRRWRLQPGPKTGACAVTLHGVAALALGDAWAVGSCGSHAVIEHWNGSKWTIRRGTGPAGASFSALTAVTAASASDIWAVGSYTTGGGAGRALIEHWNGRTWHVMASPVPGSDPILFAATAVSATNAWAAGAYVSASSAEL